MKNAGQGHRAVDTVADAAHVAVPDAREAHHTRHRVARSVLEHGASTTAELAARLDLTPAAVRRHLEALVAEGTLTVRARPTPGPRGRGRPAKVFVLTDSGRSGFDSAYDDLAAGALRFLRARGGQAAVQDFARERVAVLGERVGPTLARTRGRERVSALATALTTQGYAASVQGTAAGGVQLCQHHCPVANVAEQFPQLCEAETELFARLLGTHVQRLATIAHGDGICTTHVPDTHTDMSEHPPTHRPDGLDAADEPGRHSLPVLLTSRRTSA